MFTWIDGNRELEKEKKKYYISKHVNREKLKIKQFSFTDVEMGNVPQHVMNML